MNNPFDILRKKREAEQAEKFKELKIQHLAEEELDKNKTKVFLYFDDLVTRYSPMIESVLKQLLEAQYPNLKISCPYDNTLQKDALAIDFHRDAWRPNWSISKEEGYTDDYGKYHEQWLDVVTVSLDIDQKRYPFFVCFAKNRKRQCKLSEIELVKTLLELHK